MSDVLVLERPARLGSVMRDYLALSKSRIVMMVLITTAAGYLFGAKHVDWMLLLNTLLGTALVAAGTNALNQYIERDYDAKMRRTRLRPLPDGRIAPRAALVFSIAISILGTLYLGFAVNWLTAALGAFTLITYIFIYTPLKRLSAICTLIGAIPGAIPPLMGWTAATGVLGTGGWIIFAILFFWQLPHFMAISWMYRDDYARGGFAMLAVQDDDGRTTARHAVFYSFALLTVSVLPPLFGLSTFVYLAGAVIAGGALTFASFAFLASRTPVRARRLFMASNIYLVVMMALLILA
ncbi:MAG: protoheme IX farnesyltransferase [Acidobacteria bacterium]|nr:protoheme IX farnesyltransferase [Acidobacteriota bacterium]MBV9184454.1 protoheme IX farnesyltransferase [Acidobacteriota bacterium]